MSDEPTNKVADVPNLQNAKTERPRLRSIHDHPLAPLKRNYHVRHLIEPRVVREPAGPIFILDPRCNR